MSANAFAWFVIGLFVAIIIVGAWQKKDPGGIGVITIIGAWFVFQEWSKHTAFYIHRAEYGVAVVGLCAIVTFAVLFFRHIETLQKLLPSQAIELIEVIEKYPVICFLTVLIFMFIGSGAEKARNCESAGGDCSQYYSSSNPDMN